ncbi:CPBP family intramembrane glutamic endopeptidase [Streptococcus mitis]|uniref:CPBP family intramembrane glutamic endopeptidase n=1 Tax=Streptococcus mitis TaxID=28037 RepID=UPI00200179C6|nr:type II CAAX endopeptidase family protein [Streptococcus mitis]
MKRIIPVYIFQQVNVLLVSLYLLKFLCIGELTILQILYGSSLISFLWMYGQRKQAHKIDMKSRMKWLGIGLASLMIISLCFSLIHAPQGSTNQANLIELQYQVPWFSFLLFLINASMVEEFLYREILWNLVRKLDIRIALTSVLFALAHHPGTILAWCLYVSLGMFLGMVRYKSDLWGSMGLHLVWNLLVYSLLLV